MKKILYIITKLENNGPNRVLENMLTGIDVRKYKIYVLSLLKPERINKYPNIEYLSFDLNGVFDILTKGPKMIKKLVNEIKPDIVHSHGIFPDYLNSLLRNTYRICTLHCNIYDDYKYAYGYVKGNFMIKLHIHALKKLDKVVCCSKAVKDAIGNYPNFTYIDNGIKDNMNTNNTNLRKELNISDDDIIYIYAGRLIKRKNVLNLVRLFAQNIKENEHLILLGEGEEKDKIVEISKDIPNIHVLGYKNNTLDYLSISNVYVSFSLSEGLSISAIEALSNGLLLLLSDIPSHNEFFNKDNTYIGECFTENSFKDKLDNIIKNVKNTNRKDIFNYKNAYFSDKSIMNKYEEIYDKRI